jgi:transposase-like protein
MKSIPNFSSNLTYWRGFNRLVFGTDLLCPHCNSAMLENYRLRYLWCSICRKKYRYSSYRVGLFYSTKLSSKQLYQLIWCYLNKKSIDTTRSVTGLSYPTVERWIARFRNNLPETDVGKLTGFIQMDESFFGRLKHKQEQVIVVGAIEADSGRIKLELVPNRSSETLGGFIDTHIATNATVVTDKWRAYDEITMYPREHLPVNHSIGEFRFSNRIEGLWSEIKKHIRRMYQKILTGKLEPILKEWQERHNNPRLFESVDIFTNYLFQIS